MRLGNDCQSEAKCQLRVVETGTRSEGRLTTGQEGRGPLSATPAACARRAGCIARCSPSSREALPAKPPRFVRGTNPAFYPMDLGPLGGERAPCGVSRLYRAYSVEIPGDGGDRDMP